MTASRDWDGSYTAAEPAPWDIGRPQPAFTRLAGAGLLSGQVLDAGCGTGEHTLLAAAHGADATGMDISARAIEAARAKAAERGVTARFEVADMLDLGPLEFTAGTVIDSGLFHTFSDADRPRYVASIASVLPSGGTCFLMCFSDLQPGDFGPRRVRQEELRHAFRDGWVVEDIVEDSFEINPHFTGTTTARAWLATIRRR